VLIEQRHERFPQKTTPRKPEQVPAPIVFVRSVDVTARESAGQPSEHSGVVRMHLQRNYRRPPMTAEVPLAHQQSD
jgi:hypothetical protein